MQTWSSSSRASARHCSRYGCAPLRFHALRRRTCKRFPRDTVAEVEQPPENPVAPQRGHERQTIFAREVRFTRPRVCSTEILAFDVEPREPLRLLRPHDLRSRALRERQVELQVACPACRAIAGLVERFLRVLPDGFQHPVSIADGFALNQRLLD